MGLFNKRSESQSYVNSSTRKSFQVNKVKQTTGNTGYLNSTSTKDDHINESNFLQPPVIGLGIDSPSNNNNNKVQNPRLSKLLSSPRILTDPGIVGETKRSEILEKQLREVSIHASNAFDQVDELSSTNEMLLEQVNEQKNMIMQLLYQLKLLENDQDKSKDNKEEDISANTSTTSTETRSSRNSTSSEASSKMSLGNNSVISNATTIDQINEQKEEISKQLRSSIIQNEKLMTSLEFLRFENSRLTKSENEKKLKIQDLEYKLLDKNTKLTNQNESELNQLKENLSILHKNQNNLSMVNSQINELEEEFEKDIVPIRKLILCEKYNNSNKVDYFAKDETFVINGLRI